MRASSKVQAALSRFSWSTISEAFVDEKRQETMTLLRINDSARGHKIAEIHKCACVIILLRNETYNNIEI